jgi:hypothetical protein
MSTYIIMFLVGFRYFICCASFNFLICQNMFSSISEKFCNFVRRCIYKTDSLIQQMS